MPHARHLILQIQVMRRNCVDRIRSESFALWLFSIPPCVIFAVAYDWHIVLCLVPTSVWFAFSIGTSDAARSRMKAQIGGGSPWYGDRQLPD